MGSRMHPKPKIWMLDGKDYVKELRDDSACGRRRQLRHLMPMPSTSGKGGPPSPFIASSGFKANAFSWNHHLSKEESITEPLVSSRWNPTPEQLKLLQEMYQRGVRTPSAEEIQLIAAKLRHFGRIEGKNVFYWFQNHKARERQKRRRQPESLLEKNVQDFETLETKETSLCWKYLEARQNKKFLTTSNCRLATKGPAVASMQETAVTESRANGWTHFDEKQQRQSGHRSTAKGATFLMDLSFITPNYDQSTINAPSTSEEETSGTAEQKQSTSLRFEIFSSNQGQDLIKQNRLLQLFPLRDEDHNPTGTTDRGDEEVEATSLNPNFPPNHFYKFL